MRSAVRDTAIVPAKTITSDCLFRSDFYEIKNWEYDFRNEKEAVSGYNDCLCFVYVKRGSLLFNMSSDSYDTHTGHIIIDKPDYEYRLRPSYGGCSIFNFSNEFYRQLLDDLNLKYHFFFSNENILSLLLNATAECDYLHFQILQQAKHLGKLGTDNLVIELLKQIIATISSSPIDYEPHAALRKFHLATIEKAKEFIHTRFASDISLREISSHSCVSPFYFSRIFKQFTSCTPHQYLTNTRLKHGEILLKNTRVPVTDISISSGFITAEYFSTAFKQKYKMSPTQYRRANQ